MHFWAYSTFSNPSVWIGYFQGAHIRSPGCVFCQFLSPPCAGSRRSGAAAEHGLSPAALARPRLSACCSSNQTRSHKQCECNDFRSASSCQVHGWNGIHQSLPPCLILWPACLNGWLLFWGKRTVLLQFNLFPILLLFCCYNHHIILILCKILTHSTWNFQNKT